MIKYKKQILIIVIILFTLFTLSGCKNKEQIQLLSNKIAELKKTNEGLSSEIQELKLNNQKLIESNGTLQNENTDLKKKLEAAEANK
jgi:peptidoglycan-N-acetylglucosamine deacetylase